MSYQIHALIDLPGGEKDLQQDNRALKEHRSWIPSLMLEFFRLATNCNICYAPINSRFDYITLQQDAAYRTVRGHSPRRADMPSFRAGNEPDMRNTWECAQIAERSAKMLENFIQSQEGNRTFVYHTRHYKEAREMQVNGSWRSRHAFIRKIRHGITAIGSWEKGSLGQSICA